MKYLMRTTISPVAVLLPLLLAGCSAMENSQRERKADRYFRLGYFGNACSNYRELVAENPGDPDLQRKHRVSRVAAMLQQGQEAFFEDRIDEGERWFRRVLTLVPGQKQALAWLERTRRKQSEELAREAKRQFDLDHREKALRLTRRALELHGENRRAAELLARIEEQKRREQAKGRDLFERGMKRLMEAMDREELAYVLHLLQTAKEKLGEAFTRAELIEEIRRRIVDKHLLEVRAQFLNENYPGALLDLRYLESLAPENGEVESLKQRVQREFEADRHADDAKAYLVRGEVEKAKQALQEAARISRERSGLFKAGLERVREVALELDYKAALDREARGAYREAIAALERILDRSPAFRDAQPRVRSLRENLEESERLMARARQAERAGNRQLALSLVRQVFAIFPWYPDAILMRKRLEEKKAGGEAGK